MPAHVPRPLRLKGVWSANRPGWNTSFTMTATAGFIALLVASATVSADVICSLDGYDTSSLMRQDYWFFNVHSQLSECIPGEDSSLCQIFFGICNKLPSSLCPNSNSGACQKVTLKDKTIHKYSLGHPPEELIVNSGTNGFFASYLNGTNTASCPSSVMFTLSFLCNESHPWDVSNPDVTEHVLQYIVDSCRIFVEIWYSGACVKEEPDIAGCNSVGRYYNTFALRSEEQRIAKVDEKYCTEGPSSLFSNGTLSVGGAADTCVLFFSFCSSLPSGYCYDSIFCYQEPTTPVSFGSYNIHFKVEGNADYTGFTISAYNGTRTKECPNGLMSTLVFTCSNSSEWTSVDISMFTHPQPRDKLDPCNFEVRFDYNGACADNPPQPGKKGGNKGSAIVRLILFGIFLGVLAPYLCVGVVVLLVLLARRRKELSSSPTMNSGRCSSS